MPFSMAGAVCALVTSLLLHGCIVAVKCPEIRGFGGSLVDAEFMVDFSSGEVIYEGRVVCNSDPTDEYPVPSLGKLLSRFRGLHRGFVSVLEARSCPGPDSPIYHSIESHIVDLCFPRRQVRISVNRYALLDTEGRPLVVDASFEPEVDSYAQIALPYITSVSQDIRHLMDKDSYYIRLNHEPVRSLSLLKFFEDPTRLVILQSLSSFMADAVLTPTDRSSRQTIICQSEVYDTPQGHCVRALAISGGYFVLYTVDNVVDSLRAEFLEMTTLIDTQCVICLDEVQNGESVQILPCNHCFHEGCIKSWTNSNSSCPTCRRPSE